MTIESYSKKENNLGELFKYLDNKYFENKLGAVDVSIDLRGSLNKRRPFSEKLGNCYKLMIPVVLLIKKPEEIADFFMHEMVHIYANLNGIKATSRQEIYHNKKFKDIATESGMYVTYNQDLGWSETHIINNKDVIEKIQKIDIRITQEEYDNIMHDYVEKNVKRQKLINYKCPICNCSIYTGKEVTLECMKCHVP